MNGNVFDIQRYSTHDGPGIRTTIFLKGCSLRCFWCHNPESINAEPEIMLFRNKCIGCGRCFEVCKAGAHRMVDGQRVFAREVCQGCGACTEQCYSNALVLKGKSMTVEEVVEIIEEDSVFYENSGGGVTFSGGEALLQKEFLLELLKQCKFRGIHAAVDTAGNVPWQSLEEVLPYTDLFLFDLKVMEDEKHKSATGVSNRLLLDNLYKLSSAGAAIHVRIPVIPGINNSEDNMKRVVDFTEGLTGIKQIDLIPLHKMAVDKYKSLDLQFGIEEFDMPNMEEMESLSQLFIGRGLKAVIA